MKGMTVKRSWRSCKCSGDTFGKYKYNENTFGNNKDCLLCWHPNFCYETLTVILCLLPLLKGDGESL